MKTAITILAILFLLPSCLLKPRLDGRVWNLVDVSGAPASDLVDMQADQKPNDFIRLYPDSTYTARLEKQFLWGKWKQSKDKLVFLVGDTTVITYNIIELGVSELVLQKTMPDPKEGEPQWHFEPGAVMDDPASDAYSLKNNLWEIHATHKESLPEIVSRVKNHLRCELLFITKAIEKKEEIISTGQFPTPIAYYGNGLALKHWEDVPKDWKTTFYDNDDAQKAYEVFKDCFNSDVAIPDTKNHFLLYKGILQQLYTNVNKIPLILVK